jgi:hypothetical protein
MKQKIENVLDELIAEMAKGKAVGDCLRECPQHEEELKSLLQLAASINEMPKPEPDAEAVLAAMSRLQRPATQWNRFNLKGFFTLRMVPIRIVTFILFLFVVEVTTVSLSAKSVPGQFLYPVKRFSEDVQHMLTLDSEGMAKLHVALAGRRIHEWSCLVEPGIPVDCALLDDMVKEIEHAFEHLPELSPESRVRVLEEMHRCNLLQVEALEEGKKCACDCNIDKIEEALGKCLKHRECLECIKYRLQSESVSPPVGS